MAKLSCDAMAMIHFIRGGDNQHSDRGVFRQSLKRLSLCTVSIFSTALAVLFTLVDSGIHVCMYVVVYIPVIALTVLDC